MTDDPRPRRLPLADAVLAWTPSHLMDAIREAEAAVPADELARWARDPIAAIASRRARPQRGRTLSLAGLPASIAALDRAWDAVFDDIRLKVETCAIQLTGRMARPDNRQNPEPIPGVWGRALDFDLRAGAIFMQDQIFVAVEALAPVTDNGRRLTSDDQRNPTGDGNGADDATQHLTLLESFVHWGDPRLVNRVREEERKLIAREHQHYPMPKLTHESEWAQPANRSWMIETSYVALTAAWDDLKADFRDRIARSEIYLEGVLSSDDPNAQPEAIPNIWAAELEFDLRANVVIRDKRRYLAVTVSLKPSPWTPINGEGSEPGSSDAQQTISPQTAGRLTDEALFTLLAEYARRVVEEEGSSLKLPVKVSFIPILRRKMRHRFALGENAPTLGAEAHALERWIRSKVDGHQTPTAGHIENELREEHRHLKSQHPSPGSKDRQS